MLNWEEISAYIENPNLCSQNDLQELKGFCDKFPFSQVFPLLYLKVLSEGNHVNFEEELELYAHKITDRVQLYNLLFHNDNVDLIAESETMKVNLDEKNQEEITFVYNKSNEKNEITLDSENYTEISDTNEEAKELYTIENQELIENKQSEPILDELDKEILTSSAISSFVFEELEPEIKDSVMPEFDLTIRDEVDSLEINLEYSKESITNRNSLSEKTFLEWLTKSQVYNEIQEDYSSYEVTYIEFEKPRKEFFSPIKKARESLSEEGLPVSETLAKIYSEQGNISKAIDVYKQLCLIIPEKKSYFASQIKSLKKK